MIDGFDTPKALYTEYLFEYLQRDTERENAIKLKFAGFYQYTTNEVSFNMYDLFVNAYKFREIGAETEELFTLMLYRKIDEIIIKYNEKIKIMSDNFSKLMDRIVTENGNNEHATYYNPTNVENSDILQGKERNEFSQDRTFGYFKSNPEIMEKVAELESLYVKALKEFNSIFMGLW